MTFRFLKARTSNKAIEMRYGKLATTLGRTKRSPAVKEFRLFEASNTNRRILSRLA